MSEIDLPGQLEAAVARLDVGPPPVDTLLARGRRRRRRRTAGQTALTVVAIAAVGWLGVALPEDDRVPEPPTTAASTTDPPDGSRLFGYGNAFFVLPETWGVDALHCGTPVENTVITNLGNGATELCLIERPPVDVVEIWYGKPRQGHAFGRYDPTSVDGVPAEITPVRCWQSQTRQLCRRALHVPSSNVTFVAEGPDDADLDTLLGRVEILEDRVVVPFAHDGELIPVLEAAGVDVRTREQVEHGRDAGTVLSVSPVPGSVVRRGDVVTVTVARAPGPDDDAWVWFRTYGAGGGLTVSDPNIRRGQRITSRVGHTIGLTTEGGTVDTVAAELDGTSVVPAPGEGAHPRRFVVQHRGTTRMTIYTVEDGARTEIGEVVVYAP